MGPVEVQGLVAPADCLAEDRRLDVASAPVAHDRKARLVEVATTMTKAKGVGAADLRKHAAIIVETAIIMHTAIAMDTTTRAATITDPAIMPSGRAVEIKALVATRVTTIGAAEIAAVLRADHSAVLPGFVVPVDRRHKADHHKADRAREAVRIPKTVIAVVRQDVGREAIQKTRTRGNRDPLDPKPTSETMSPNA